MPAYQIHRLKETQRQQFRWAPHTPGVTIVKLKDYEVGAVIEAASPYALWLEIRESDNAIAVGDLIEVVGDLPGGEPLARQQRFANRRKMAKALDHPIKRE